MHWKYVWRPSLCIKWTLSSPKTHMWYFTPVSRLQRGAPLRVATSRLGSEWVKSRRRYHTIRIFHGKNLSLYYWPAILFTPLTINTQTLTPERLRIIHAITKTDFTHFLYSVILFATIFLFNFPQIEFGCNINRVPTFSGRTYTISIRFYWCCRGEGVRGCRWCGGARWARVGATICINNLSMVSPPTLRALCLPLTARIWLEMHYDTRVKYSQYRRLIYWRSFIAIDVPL